MRHLALTVALLAASPAAAQQQIAGRYLVSVAEGSAVLIDSATGESWVYSPGDPGWRALDFVLPDGASQRLPPPERAYRR